MLKKALASAQTGSTSTRNSEVTATDRQATNYVFGLMAVIFGDKKMSVTYPDEMLNKTKRMYAAELGRFDRSQIDKGLEFLKARREAGDTDYEWPNCDRLLGAIKQSSRVRSLHRTYEPPIALIGHDKEVAKAAGAKALKAMREMF